MIWRRKTKKPDRTALFTRKAKQVEAPIVELKNVSKTYAETTVPVPALRGVSLSVKRGEMIAIMGPSGSGKTSLLNMIGLIDLPDQGSILFRGTDVRSLKRRQIPGFRQSQIGFIFQHKNTIPTLTAYENVYLPFRYKKGAKSEKRESTEEALRLVGMLDRADHRPSQLSGGQLQRVAIARALALSPAVILADEPTGELDSKTGNEVIKLMKELNQRTGQTFIIVTHNDAVAAACDRVLTMTDGKLRAR